MRSYIKNKKQEIEFDILKDEIDTSKQKTFKLKKMVIGLFALLFILPLLAGLFTKKELNSVAMVNEEKVQFTQMPIAATSGKRSVITIPDGMVKANPFLPYRDLGGVTTVADVPSYTLVAPPETLNENSDAARVMDTIVSGILFDKYSPSAILNIEGNDYLVKKGDVVNNYKVVNIAQDTVTVKLGANVYKAGIGEILTEGSINHNDVSNLNNKFGGIR